MSEALDQIARALGLCADEGHDTSLLISRAEQLKAARDEAIKERDEQRARADLEIRRVASYRDMFDNAFQRRQHALAEAKSLQARCLELGRDVNNCREEMVRFMRERDEAIARALKLGDALRAVQAQPDDEKWLDAVTYWHNRASFMERALARTGEAP